MTSQWTIRVSITLDDNCFFTWWLFAMVTISADFFHFSFRREFYEAAQKKSWLNRNRILPDEKIFKVFLWFVQNVYRAFFPWRRIRRFEFPFRSPHRVSFFPSLYYVSSLWGNNGIGHKSSIRRRRRSQVNVRVEKTQFRHSQSISFWIRFFFW